EAEISECMDDEFIIFRGNYFTTEGLLVKMFPINTLITKGIEPSLNELKHFEIESAEDLKSYSINYSGKEFFTGDKVCVISGDLENLTGKVIKVSDSVVTIQPFLDTLNMPIEFSSNELKKTFDAGDHVKVIAENNSGETGHILHSDGHFATILLDNNFRELKLKTDNLQLSEERSSGIDESGKYQYGDMILM
ncbi:MAG: Transcription elongation factor SPT5, partial [Paramarteilia canceri]